MEHLQMYFQQPFNTMKILSSLLLLFALAGCSNSDETSTTSGSNTGSTGDLLGTMQLTDHRGRTMSDHSGVAIQIEGTSFSAVSDASGNWVIHDLPTKTYAITFSKPNFYTRRNPSYTFVGGVPARYIDPSAYFLGTPFTPIPLGELPEFTVTLDAVTMPSKVIDNVKKTISYLPGKVFAHTSDTAPDSADIGMYTIVGKRPDLRIDDTTSYFFMAVASTRMTAPGDTTANLIANLSYLQLQSYGIQPGDVVYFKAYPVVGFPYQINTIANKYEYIGYGTTSSNQLSATMQ